MESKKDLLLAGVHYWLWKTPCNYQPKFYSLHLSHSLFNDIILEKTWGRIENRKSRNLTCFYDQISEVLIEIERIHKRRLSRGYKLARMA